MDLVGAVGETQGAGARPQVGEWEIVRDPCASVGLYRSVQDVQGRVRGDDLYHGDLGACLLVADGIHHVRSLQGQETRLLYLHPGV